MTFKSEMLEQMWEVRVTQVFLCSLKIDTWIAILLGGVNKEVHYS